MQHTELNWIERLQAPHWSRDLGQMQAVRAVTVVAPQRLSVELILPFFDPLARAWLQEALFASLPGWQVELELSTAIQPVKRSAAVLSLPRVRNLIAVASGKGGVGKSTTTVNLALALAQLGARVGILDADIYGPSIPTMLGTVGQHPDSPDGKAMLPVAAHGLVANSIGYLIDSQEAAIWRGPMASKALQQIARETRWPELDYLMVDLPPGTGDIQLTLAQQLPVSAAVVVTTPQDIALADARRSITMFAKVQVPVVGIVENMSLHVCSRCGHEEPIFGTGGASRLATEVGSRLLAQLPLHIAIREHADRGEPLIQLQPDSLHSRHYLELAAQLSQRLYFDYPQAPEEIPTISG